jgi:hypothetical protein
MVVKRRCLFSSGSARRRGLTDLRAILHLLKHLLDFGESKLAGVVLLQRVELAGGDLVRSIAFGSAWKARPRRSGA